MLPIYKKEIRTYFTQMTGYIFLTALVLLLGLFYIMLNVQSMNGEFYAVLSGTTLLFFLLIPVLTMRLFAEETRQKTDQLLFTSRLTVFQIVFGKFLASTTLFLIGVGITVLFPLMLSYYGAMPWGQILAAYTGYALLGICFISVGLFVSVLTDNQIIAAVATVASLFLLFIMDAIISIVPTETVYSLVFVAVLILGAAGILYNSTKSILAAVALGIVGVAAAVGLYFINNLIYDGFIAKALNWFSVFARFDNLTSGVFHISDVVYYISFALLFMYLTVNVIEKRRWR